MAELRERPTVVLAMAPALTPDLFSSAQRDRLTTLCHLPDPHPLQRFDDERATGLLAQADVLLTGWGCPRIDASVLARAPSLRAIIHAAGTVKGHVDTAVWARGVRVSTAAAANAVPVAEYTVAAIVFANKRIFRLQRLYYAARGFRLWPRQVPDLGNHERTIGLVGASRIGRLVIERLRPFDFQVLVQDPFLTSDEAARLGVERVSLDDLVARADVVSLHAPSLPETHHLLDARRLALMRDGAVVINTARGALVDMDALTRELVSGRLDAVLDVTEPEVLPKESPLYDLPNVWLTPHVAGALGRETQRMADLALSELARYVRGEPFEHEVRVDDLARIA